MKYLATYVKYNKWLYRAIVDSVILVNKIEFWLYVAYFRGNGQEALIDKEYIIRLMPFLIRNISSYYFNS
jgi:hypothetical protein